MTHIHFDDLASIRNRHRNKTIVFCSGGFDLTHPGHILFFEDCKKQGDILVVGIGPDAARRREKGSGRPILNEHMRMKMISSLKPVDYAFIIIPEPETHQLDPLRRVMGRLQPDVYVINSDAYDIPYREMMAKEFNTKLIILERWSPPEFEGISTTKLIEKIKNLK